ncbi:RHS repeat-associated core domain-containing protein [Chryseobacterium sp. JAH]|uniref:RHS repeat-associated core domain-containing protein n=1 Tax=Chryseobacterium sp. JAH TaxID=1742858 RepID=UPI0007410560|nr:RHS repeat-associated core domain-containing protein [Chryseobacterium sp. JAH]KUJ50002.1 hypothetical protein AR685_16565 [Chryseobacterium sp. JAH]
MNIGDVRNPNIRDPNPNNVIYQYGSNTAGNNAGKLITKTDGTGDAVYKYGRMGEVISELRIVRGHHIPEMYFKTYFNYDSWNRITKIKYPDDEIVSYHYNFGGNLKSVNNNYGETYIENINYDDLEQLANIYNGNGTFATYTYDQNNRRLDSYKLSNQVLGSTMLYNSYLYDEHANITTINNQALALQNGMGGAFKLDLSYDTLNRLIGTVTSSEVFWYPDRVPDGTVYILPSTSLIPSTYQLEMKYNNVGGITQKIQHHERDQQVVHENTYDNKYEYVQNTHKLEKVSDALTGNGETFEYDFNGNAVNHNDNAGTKRMYWDEQERLKAFYNDNSGTYQYYSYDDKGEKVIKYGLEAPSQLYQNGAPLNPDELRLFEYKIYPNPYVTVSSTGQYTKHYFEGSKRFASRLMDGAVRFEDPAVLYSSRTTDDKPSTKPADSKSDFEKYLEKAGLSNGVALELRERPWSPDLYYLHGDHLGTASFVTNSQAEATQFFLNLPFGETMIEQMDGTYDNPFKFNAKKLDDDTGLYYYGARYYNPRLSIWYGVDPLAEQMPSWSPYSYTFDNPVRYVDPTGMIAEDCPKCPNPQKADESRYGSDGKYYTATEVSEGSSELEWLRTESIQEVKIKSSEKAQANYNYRQASYRLRDAEAKAFGMYAFGITVGGSIGNATQSLSLAFNFGTGQAKIFHTSGAKAGLPSLDAGVSLFQMNAFGEKDGSKYTNVFEGATEYSTEVSGSYFIGGSHSFSTGKNGLMRSAYGTQSTSINVGVGYDAGVSKTYTTDITQKVNNAPSAMGKWLRTNIKYSPQFD